ncbi:hypothetical protein [Nocardioides stalactiti]|uniref:hypothetical protein n=1 Tax=Nocardioides stalactiti TaxID=2755356 RepID=UPI0015FF72E5|nr:hypothetical protein [Nocardioides stalactiti]
MASEPLDDPRDDPRDDAAWAERCADAEQQVADLTAELVAAQARISELEAEMSEPRSIFDGTDSIGAGLARDGSDPRALSLILAATAVVAGMVAFLALLNGNLSTPFGFAMILTTLGLAYAATRTRVGMVEVSITRGVVYIEKGESSYRFDVRNEHTLVDMDGEPGDSYWQVRFHRKGMDDFVVDADMVDPHEFVRQLREHRPSL